MLKKIFYLLLVFIATIFLASCGGGSGGGVTTSGEAISTTGIAVDPYISNSKFYIDSNQNGSYDNGEPISGSSDVNGIFTFSTSMKKGDVVRMHPSYKGKHNGIDYTGNLIEGKVENALANGRVVFSPITTIASKHSLSEEQVVEIINDAFEDQNFMTVADIYSDPMDQVNSAVSDAALNRLQAAIAVNGMLDVIENTQAVKNAVDLLPASIKTTTLGELMKPIAANIKEALSTQKLTEMNNVVSGITGAPTVNMDTIVKTAVSVNNEVVNSIKTAVSGATDPTTMATTMTSTVSNLQATIATNTKRIAMSNYIADNYTALSADSTLKNNVITAANTAVGEDLTTYFDAITDDSVISENTYTLTLNTNDNSMGTVQGGGVYSAGQTVEISATAATNHGFIKWIKGTEEVSTTATYSFLMPNENTTLTAQFEQSIATDLTLTAITSNVWRGSISLPTNGTATLDEGDTIEVRTTLATVGYKFDNWSTTGNGTFADATSIDTVFTMGSTDETITANWGIDTSITKDVVVSIGAGDEAKGNVSGSGTYHLGDTVEIRATPNSGYRFDKWTSSMSGYVDDVNSPSIDFTLIPMDYYDILAWFVVDTGETFSLTLTKNDDTFGTVSGAGNYYVGQSVSITATPATGYEFVNWKYGDVVVSTNSTYTYTMPAAARTLTANFQIKSYSLSYSAGANGSITGTASQTVDHGSDGSAVTALPDTGYRFDKWSDNSTDNPRTDTSVSGDITVTAQFVPDFAGGSGTSGDPYLVATAKQLNNVRNFIDSYFKQTANIDLTHGTLSGESWYDSTNGWLPIGDDSGMDSGFSGTYNGDGYTISNLYIDRGTTDYNGLFGFVDQGQINYVGVVNADITGNQYNGVLAGYAINATIYESFVSGSVVGNSFNTSGFIGLANNGNTIDDCYSVADVEGYNNPCGFAAIGSGTITNCYAAGSVSAIAGSGSPDPQGFTGTTMGATISDCFWDVNTSGESDSGDGTGLDSVLMKRQASFTNWDFSFSWSIDEDSTYPYLVIQNGSNKPDAPANFAGGDGSLGAPYQVATAKHLHNVRYYLDKYFVQTADIDLTHATLSNEGWYDSTLGWTPIGYVDWNATSGYFSGYYNGDGYTISNLYINGVQDISEPYIGLFGLVRNAVGIDNIGVINADVTGYYDSGILIGYVDNSIVSNCFTTGTITGYQLIGGLLGELSNSSVLNNSYSIADVSSSDGYAGGVSGGASSSTFNNCYAAGSISGTNSKGFAYSGMNSYTANDCFWDKVATGQATSGDIDGDADDPIGLDSAPMMREASFTNWDFTSKWTIDEDSTYPYLVYQLGTNKPTGPTLFSGGDGTSGTPYQVANAYDLHNVRYFLDKYFVQTSAIDLTHATLSNESWYDSTNGWLPIGDLTNKFAGSYDGANYTVSNLFIDRSSTDYVGLFGWIDTCPGISNLGVLSVDITGNNSVGALVGYSNAVTGITKCYSSGSITGNNYGGGLIGYIADSVPVSNCYSTASVTTPNRVGGLAGHADMSTLTNCYATGALSASPGNAFGIAGTMMGLTTTNCFYDSDTTGATNTGGTETGATTANMIQQATFTGWDFGSTWTTNGDTTYPQFQ